ncbi:hypothetical protein B7494_g8406 [Chlorociboria aeruginascens]|nr:hypothetical protein B7494_g8406 [Chlorociboria aeruginascens]
MPHIRAAMERSVRRGIVDILVDSLQKRTVEGEVSSVKNSFSSWDNCMQAAYCKWPVIVVIVIVSLIVLSVVWCICCGCCDGCCDGRKDKPHKHLDDPEPYRSPTQGYQAPSPMMGGAVGGKSAVAVPPQYAQFEVGKNGFAVDPKNTGLSEDALPPMPSWEAANKKHILEEKNGVELGELDPTTGQKVPLMSGAGVSSPINENGPSPFGTRPGQGAGVNGYMGQADPYRLPPNTLNPDGRGYGQQQPGMPGNPQSRGYGTPPPNMAGQGRGYGPPSPQGYTGGSNEFAVAPVGGYGRGPPQRQYSNDSNRPYPPQQPQRQYSNDSSRPLNPGRQFSDRSMGSDRTYPSDNFGGQPARGPSRGPPGGPGRLTSPPPNNNSGFDFGGNQGYNSRPNPSQVPYPTNRPTPPPQQNSYSQVSRNSPTAQQGGFYQGSTAPPSYASRSPPPQEQNYSGPESGAGSGYRAYNPQGSSQPRAPRAAPSLLIPGGGRGAPEPETWDPVQR